MIKRLHTGPKWGRDRVPGSDAIGTVKAVNPPDGPEGTVCVHWDDPFDNTAGEGMYCMGHRGRYDLEVIMRPRAKTDALVWGFSSCCYRAGPARCDVMWPVATTKVGDEFVRRVACEPPEAGSNAALGFVVDFEARTLSFFLVSCRCSEAFDAQMPRAPTHTHTHTFILPRGSVRCDILSCLRMSKYM